MKFNENNFFFNAEQLCNNYIFDLNDSALYNEIRKINLYSKLTANKVNGLTGSYYSSVPFY